MFSFTYYFFKINDILHLGILYYDLKIQIDFLVHSNF